MATISVIIPVYNVEPYVEACLRSVMEQEHSGFDVECIIVDDCGTDNSMEVVLRTITDYKGDIEFKLLTHDKNKGLSAARNTALREAKGDYVTFLDSDDYLLPGALSGMYQLTVKYTGVEIVQGEVQLDKPDKGLEPYLGITSVGLPVYISDRNVAKRAILFDMPVTSWAKLIRRAFIIDNNLYFTEGIIHEDDMWDVCASQYIKSIAFYFTPVYYYRNNLQNTITGNPDKTRSMIARMLILQKATECCKKDPCLTYYNYIIWKLDVSHKIENWAKVQDQRSVKEAINRMYKILSKTKCGPLKIAAWYYSLPIFINRNRLISFIHRRFFNGYKNRWSQKLL